MPRWLPALLLALPACGGWMMPQEDEGGFDNPVFDIYEEDVTVPAVPMCGDMQIYPEAVPPNLLLVVDKSGSMDDPISSNANQSASFTACTPIVFPTMSCGDRIGCVSDEPLTW